MIPISGFQNQTCCRIDDKVLQGDREGQVAEAKEEPGITIGIIDKTGDTNIVLTGPDSMPGSNTSP